MRSEEEIRKMLEISEMKISFLEPHLSPYGEGFEQGWTKALKWVLEKEQVVDSESKGKDREDN